MTPEIKCYLSAPMKVVRVARSVVMRHLLFWSFVVCLSLCSLSVAWASEGEVCIDLTKHDFVGGEAVYLRGDVEFYWGEILSPNDFRRGRHNNPTILQIPGSWRGQEVNERSLPSNGCATYRFRLVVPPLEEEQEYAIHVPIEYSSYRMWVNGELLASVGKVANNPYDAQPSSRVTAITLRERIRKQDTLEFIFQMSNFHSPVAGLVTPMRFGTEQALRNYRFGITNFHYLLLGALALLFLMNLLLFWGRKEQYSFWFAFGSVLAIIRIVFGESDLLQNYLPWLTWSLYHKVLYLSSLGAMMSLFLFVHCRYRGYLKDSVVHWVNVVGLVLGIFFFFTPVAIFTHLRVLLYLYYVAIFVLLWLKILVHAIRRIELLSIALGCLALMVCMALNGLQGVFHFETLFPYVTLGTTLFVLIVICAMSWEFSYLIRKATEYKLQVGVERAELENKIKQLSLESEQQQRRYNSEQQEQRQQVWVDNGIAQLSTLMAQNQNSLKGLCEKTLFQLTKYLRVNAAMLYVARIDPKEYCTKLYMYAHYGLTQEQLENNQVLDEDQGMVGACYHDNTFQHVSNLPKGFMKISSGLGSCTPPSLLLMPLQSTAGVVGVLELGRFEDFQEYEISFVKRIAVILANNLTHTKNNEDYILALESTNQTIAQLHKQIEQQEQYNEQMAAELEEYRRG